MHEIWTKMLETFCAEMRSDVESWRVVHVDEHGASWQHKASGTVFKVEVG